ncbi:AMP-binding enzyme family protein (macronuclear) [Tetrahymena thermophila SB210]|uniref:AMP-binding enzyme family protein n=1 Tax=Tetrahymena thermophila (strain SB210) TaxID=312017 RepID=Q22UI0_TETTS|nr:AMP-binding enzyme family protein [Tetrahymena thermophila SB210]EAR88990.1 AMP-binding enzyme family protein [Tetrahymena thermophila SB210]|eukprot:XP_001009235.1 AMP-binding enzyme family protein [Tetrahymena thermophila SB210]
MFSSQFYFKLGENKQIKRGAFAGFILTLSIFLIIFSYFIYLTIQYAINGIDPKYRSQTFVTDDLIQLDLSSDMVGFRFEYQLNKDVALLESQQNKKYIVYQAYLNYQSPTFSMMKRIDIVNCTNPQLDGYYCIDYSQVSNYTLEYSSKGSVKSQVFLLAYGCLDLDHAKKTIPDNCASQKDIDDMVNGKQAALRIKLLSQQYNTTSQKVQQIYRNNFMYSYSNQALWTEFKGQKQTTSVKDGFLIQSEQSFSSLLSYDQINQSYQRSEVLNPHHGIGPYCKFSISLDEVYFQIQIQYPTYPEILAMLNNTFVIVVILGYFGRIIAQKVIKQEFFLLFLQNMYQDTYEQIMQINQIFQKEDGIYFQKNKFKKEIGNKYEELNNQQLIDIPSFVVESKYDEVKEFKEPKIGLKKISDIETDGNNSDYLAKDKIGQSNLIENEKFIHPKSTSPSVLDLPKYLSSKITESLAQVSKLKLKQFVDIDQIKLNEQQNELSQVINSQILDKEKALQFQRESIQKLNKKEINKQFKKKLEVMKNSKVSKNLQKIIFGTKLWQKKQYTNQQDFDVSVKELIESQVEKSLDILQLYQDILFLKKAVMILLSKDQLAAISLVGCSPYFLGKKNLDTSSAQEVSRRNHFEEQFAISLSNELKTKYIQKFLDKCTKDTEISDVDYRILSSVISHQIN